MASCSNCGKRVPSDANFCPRCGQRKPAESFSFGGLVLLIIIAIFIIGNKNDKSSSTSSHVESKEKLSSDESKEYNSVNTKQTIEQNDNFNSEYSNNTQESHASNEIQNSDVLYEQGTVDDNAKMKELIAKLGNGKKVKLDPKIMATLPEDPECRISEAKQYTNGKSITTEGIYCLDPEQFKYIQVDIPQ